MHTVVGETRVQIDPVRAHGLVHIDIEVFLLFGKRTQRLISFRYIRIVDGL